MENLLFYFLKAILCSGVMFLYYRIFLKDKTFHHYNRFYLLGTLVVSLLLPFLKVSNFTINVNPNIYDLLRFIQFGNSPKTSFDGFTIYQVIFAIIFLVSLFFIGKFIFGLLKINKIKKEFPQEHFEGISFYNTNLENAPFSFFRNLFWKKSILIQSDLGKQILKHEMVHIEQKHTYDKILIEILTSIFWFNPIFYLIKKEINLIHEYLADKKAIKNSDTKAFAQMLLASHFSGNLLPATSPFFNSNLKKRLTMLKKSKTKFSYVRKIFALPILFILAFAYLVNAKNKEINETNIAIAKEISTLKKENSRIKKDTINPKDSVEVAFGTDETQLYKAHPELFHDKNDLSVNQLNEIQNQIDSKNNQIQPLSQSINSKSEESRKISNELRKKSDELRKLSNNKDFNSPKYQKLEKEMDEFSGKMDGIFNTEEYKNALASLDKNYAELDQLYAKMDDIYNTKEYRESIANSEKEGKLAEKMFNSPEFKKQIRDAKLQAKKATKMVNSPEFKKQIADAQLQAKKTSEMVKSPEFQKTIKDAEKAAKEAAENGNTSKYIYVNQLKNKIVVDDDSKIYINGKPSTKAEMDNLDPKNIQNVSVTKNNKDGKNIKNEIRILTKK